MSTPSGWALANVWYDQYRGIPRHGSPLESLFMLVLLQRQFAQLLSTRALVQATLPDEKEAADPAIAAFQKYHDTMFPFLDRIGDPDKEEQRKRLEEFVRRPARIDLKPIWRRTVETAKRIKNLKRMRVKQRKP